MAWEWRVAAGKHATEPRMPRELVHALRISLDGMRPAEYWATDSDDYEQTLHMQTAFRDGVKRERARAKRIADQRAELAKARTNR